MIWSYCPVDRQDDKILGVILRILRLYLGYKVHPQTDRITGFMVIPDIDPPYLVTLLEIKS